MKITELKVDGFGVWSGLSLTKLSDHLTVFYGPNEAGKTTLMQFVRGVMYGFSAERRARYLPPVRPGRPGGMLGAATDEGRLLRISRHADDLHGGDEVVVIGRDGAALAGEPLAELLLDVDEPVFNNVFVLGLREIQELGLLSDTDAAHQLYDLTLGLDRVSLVDVLNELDSSRNRLLAADDRPSMIVQLLGQRQRLEAEAQELKDGASGYLELIDHRRELESTIEQLEQERGQADEQIRTLELAKALSDPWRRRSEATARLKAFGQVDSWPADAVARLDRVLARLRILRRRQRKLAKARRQLKAETKTLGVNEALCRQAARLEALSEQQQWIASLGGQVKQLEVEIAQLNGQRSTDEQPWSKALERHGSASEHDSARGFEQLRAHAKTLADARKRFQQAKRAIAGTQESAKASAAKIQAALGKQADRGLVKSLERAGDQVSQLRRRVQLDERLDQMTRHASELEGQSHSWLDRQMLPTWQLATLGGLFAIGFAMIVAGLLLPASVTGSMGWPLVMLGVGGAGAAAGGKLLLERFAASQLESCHKQLAALHEQMRLAKDERDALDEQLPRGGGPLVSRLQTAEKELSQLEELLPLEAQRDAAERESRAAAEKNDSARSDYRRARGRWKQALVDAGLPEDLSPQQLGDFTRRSREVRDVTRQLESRRRELVERRRELEMLSTRIAQLASEVGMALSDADPLALLRKLLTELHEQQSRLKRREAIVEQAGVLRKKAVRAGKLFEEGRRRRHALLRKAGVRDEAEFRRRAAAQAEARQLEQTLGALEQEISAALGAKATHDQIAAYFAPGFDREQIERELTASRLTLQRQLEAAFESRGQWKAQLKAMTEDRRLAETQIELGIVDQRLKEALERWRVLAVTGLMLENVRQVYERDHQPEALREASLYLLRLTAGRYARVWTPLGQHTLRVDDADGKSLPVEVLSRGTREQLFLSLRLALVGAYARRGVRLPLVLDDVLVNFDAGRSKAAAMVLRDFAKFGHQILIFTCHEHIARLFKSLKAEVRNLPDNSHPNAPVAEFDAIESPVEEPKKPRRARPEPEPVIETPAEAAEEPPVAAEPEPALVEVVAEVIEPAPEPAPKPKAVRAPKKAKPAPKPRRPAATLERVGWDAEEFEGELADRVRRREPEEFAGDETFEVEFDEDGNATEAA